ncbi:MAG: 30S ribosomal protein [Ignavibacteria bacterium]|nr:MAG: 30S ribosomal protein [Ignavibacteria bacterium]
MVGITIGENENIDKALKRFKKKYERSGILKEYKKRTFFVKPSIEKRRMDEIKAKRRASREQAMRDRKG